MRERAIYKHRARNFDDQVALQPRFESAAMAWPSEQFIDRPESAAAIPLTPLKPFSSAHFHSNISAQCGAAGNTRAHSVPTPRHPSGGAGTSAGKPGSRGQKSAVADSESPPMQPVDGFPPYT